MTRWWYGFRLKNILPPEPPEPPGPDPDPDVPSNPNLPGGQGIIERPLDNVESDSLIYPDFSMSNDVGMINTYVMNKAEINSLSNKFYSGLGTMFSNYNPTDYIVSLQQFPFDVKAKNGAYNYTEVTDIGIGDKRISLDLYVDMELNRNRILFEQGSYQVPEFYQNFIDYTDVNVSIYIPYYGLLNLNPTEVMGKLVSLEYLVDISTGGFSALIKSNGLLINQVDGLMSIQFPMNSTSQSNQTMGIVSSVIGIGTATATGNIAMGVTSAMAGVQAMNKNGSSANKSVQPFTNLYMPQTPYMYFDYPLSLTNDDYFSLKGKPVNKIMLLENSRGYTRVKDLMLNNTSITDDEKNEIIELLERGVYIYD